MTRSLIPSSSLSEVGRGGQGFHHAEYFLLFLFLALHVYLPSDQLGRESDVLSLFADGQRLLFFLDNDFHALYRWDL